MPQIYKGKMNKNYIHSIMPEKLNQPNSIEGYMQMVRWLEMNVHLQRILLKVDRATMFYSLEARVPYLSNTVLDYASSISYKDCIEDNQGKVNIKKILANKASAEWVYKKKQGFGVPMKEWIRQEIKQDVYETIMNMPTELAVAFDIRKLDKLLQNEYSLDSKSSNNGLIWAIYALVKWNEYHRKSIF